MAKIICNCGQMVSLSKTGIGRCRNCGASYTVRAKKAPTLTQRRASRKKREMFTGSTRRLFQRFIVIMLFLTFTIIVLSNVGR